MTTPKRFPNDLNAMGIEESGNWRKTTPTVSLRKLLIAAQDNHKVCVTKALEAKVDPVEKCSLTWYDVHNRWMQFAAYRAPFKTEEEEKSFAQYWTKKRVEKYERNPINM